MDPYEHAPASGDGYEFWWTYNGYVGFEGVRRIAAFWETFIEYPLSQTSARFSIDQIEEYIKNKVAQMKSMMPNT